MSTIAPNPLMFCGWELGVLDELSWRHTAAGTSYYTMSIDSAVKRTGTNSLKLDGDNGVQGDVYTWEYIPSGSGGGCGALSVAIAVRIATAPPADYNGLLVLGNRANDAGPNPTLSADNDLLVNAGRTLSLYLGGGVYLTSSTALTLGTWYNIVMRCQFLYNVGTNCNYLQGLRIYDDSPTPSLLEELEGLATFTGNITNLNAVHIGGAGAGIYNVDDLFVVTGGLWAPAGAAVPAMTSPLTDGILGADPWTPVPANDSYSADAAVTTTTGPPGTLTDTRQSWTTDYYKNCLVTCNGKTMTVASNTGTVLTGTAGWSGGGNPGNGFAYTIVIRHIRCDEAPSASADGEYIYHGGHASFARTQIFNHTLPTIPGGANELGVGGRGYVRGVSLGPGFNLSAFATGASAVSGPIITPDTSFTWRGRGFNRSTGALSAPTIQNVRRPGNVGTNIEVECNGLFVAYGPDTSYDFPVKPGRVSVM